MADKFNISFSDDIFLFSPLSFRESLLNAYRKSIVKNAKEYKIPPKWDGKASERIWNIILNKGKD